MLSLAKRETKPAGHNAAPWLSDMISSEKMGLNMIPLCVAKAHPMRRAYYCADRGIGKRKNTDCESS
jgi:hypothetical protein